MTPLGPGDLFAGMFGEIKPMTSMFGDDLPGPNDMVERLQIMQNMSGLW